MKNKMKSISVPIIYILIVLIIISIIIYIIYSRTAVQYNNDNIDEILCPRNHVCMHQKTFDQVIKRNNNIEKERESIKIIEKTQERMKYDDLAISRDKKVLNDPLFPPLARTDRITFDNVAYETRRRNINIPTKNIEDTFRQVGYVTSQEGEKDSGGGNWKLMARQKDRNESEFYLIPTNNNYDIKVPLTPEVVIGTRLKDIYTIPKNLRFKSPLLNKGSYDFVELPKTDFSDSRYL
jgi:hypothetical protein